MNLNGVEYYYIQNAQGDITGLLDKGRAQVVSYSYDTWGKLLSTAGALVSTVGAKNTYLYRGYRSDSETGLYYLQSRYYNADWGRYINADDTDVLEIDQDSLIENNLFAYCLNNPVNMIDKDGYIAWWITAAIGVSVFNSAIYMIEANGNFSWSGLGWNTLHQL